MINFLGTPEQTLWTQNSEIKYPQTEKMYVIMLVKTCTQIGSKSLSIKIHTTVVSFHEDSY